jgi:hypothetical protein
MKQQTTMATPITDTTMIVVRLSSSLSNSIDEEMMFDGVWVLNYDSEFIASSFSLSSFLGS